MSTYFSSPSFIQVSLNMTTSGCFSSTNRSSISSSLDFIPLQFSCNTNRLDLQGSFFGVGHDQYNHTYRLN